MSAPPAMSRRYPKTVKSPSAGPAPQFISPHKRPTGTARRLLAVVNGDQTDEFKLFLARRGDNFDFVANLAVEQGLADGRSCGDKAFLGVGFLAAHQGVVNLFIALQIQHRETRAVAGAVLRNIGEVQHAEIAHALLEMGDLEVDVALAFLGELVLGVFREVAMRASNGNLFGKFDAELVRKLVDFVLELFLNLGEWVGHGSRLCVR